jgi:hypothetical protein
MEDQLLNVHEFTWFQWLKEEGPWIWMLALAAVALGLWHFSISLRGLLGDAPRITIAHHLLHLFSPIALLFLGICAAPILAPPVMTGSIEGWLGYISKFPVFYGAVGLVVFVPNLLLTLIAVYRGPRHESLPRP